MKKYVGFMLELPWHIGSCIGVGTMEELDGEAREIDDSVGIPHREIFEIRKNGAKVPMYAAECFADEYGDEGYVHYCRPYKGDGLYVMKLTRTGKYRQFGPFKDVEEANGCLFGGRPVLRISMGTFGDSIYVDNGQAEYWGVYAYDDSAGKW